VDRKFLRPGWIVGHLLVVVAVLVCLRLGRWQWHRMQDGGTIQNFGYAVLWPVFGAAFVYMWFRFLQLEKLKDAEDEAELTALAAGDPSDPVAEQDGAEAVVPGTEHQITATSSTDGLPAAAEPDLSPGAAQLARVAEVVPAQQQSADHPDQAHPVPTSRVSRNTPSTGVTVAVATVGDDDENDPELAAYNRALAALAEKDHRRAR
jgi:DNA-binding transcriptional regulator of glucitol operon